MRVTKEPEVRKQEIFDTALKLFGEKGYEKRPLQILRKQSVWLRACAIDTSHLKKYCLTVLSISMQKFWQDSLLNNQKISLYR